MERRGAESERIVGPFYPPHTKGCNLPRQNAMNAELPLPDFRLSKLLDLIPLSDQLILCAENQNAAQAEAALSDKAAENIWRRFCSRRADLTRAF